MTVMIGFDDAMGASGVRLLRRLERAGFSAYFVGGCVRDALLGRPVKDYDIATSAKPGELLALFPDAIPTGLQHGTVTIPFEGYAFETTTFRAESAYSDGRHPDEVTFLDDVEGDLERRDFTVNAMAADAEGRLVDPFGGRRDLEAKRLRAVGDPAARFSEDALRMLRFVRFAAEYGFVTDEPTWREARLGASGLAAVAMERVYAELSRMIEGADPYRALRLLRDSELLRWTKERLRLPRTLGLPSPPAEAEEGASAAGASGDPLRRLGHVSDPLARWALWFDAMALSPDDAALVCRALRTSNVFERELRDVLGLHGALRGAPPEHARRAWASGAIRFGELACRRWLSLAQAVCGEPAYAWTALYAANGERWLDEMPAKTLKDLAIGGADALEAAGERRGGPWLADLLAGLLLDAALGELPNERQALLSRVRERLPRYGRDAAGGNGGKPEGGSAGERTEDAGGNGGEGKL